MTEMVSSTLPSTTLARRFRKVIDDRPVHLVYTVGHNRR